jgi:hypothetical protein
MSDSKPPRIKPMPVTSMPDRVDPNDQRDMSLKAGMKSTGNGDPTRKK